MSSWIVHARADFHAAHALGNYRGEPESPHTHHWQVAVRVGAPALGEEGYALDFHTVREILERAVRPLDGTDLNTHPAIGLPSVSAESLALHLAERLGPPYQELGGTLLSVSVWEGPDNRVDLVLEGAPTEPW